MKTTLVLVTLGIGAALLVLGLMWVTLFPGTATWTPDKAAQWAKTKDQLHNLSVLVNAPPEADPPPRGANLAEARAEYDRVKAAATKLQAEFESAYQTPRTTAAVLKWSGLGLLGLGVVGWLVVRRQEGT